jgi:hypothetical protein
MLGGGYDRGDARSAKERTILVSLSVAAGVPNALLLPFVLGFLYRLARTVPPESLRLRGAYAQWLDSSLLVDFPQRGREPGEGAVNSLDTAMHRILG